MSPRRARLRLKSVIIEKGPESTLRILAQRRYIFLLHRRGQRLLPEI